MRYCTATFLFLLFSITNNHLHSQNLKEGITNYFHSISQYPQEKLYLHLDKPYYAAGERIYWKGYLIDAISHIPQTQSNFIYIELVDRSNEIVNKSKIKREKDNFHGSILLPADIPAGEYYLRAYTQWMMNAGEDYFYYHRLRIGNALDRSIQTSPAPEIYRKIGHQMTADMSGCYSGTLITYDYSGKYVVGQKPLSIEISITGDEADICWMEEDKEPVTLHGISNDSLLVFNKAVYCRSDHYSRFTPISWEFVSSAFTAETENGKSMLHGNLQQYSPETKEMERPMYFVAEKTSAIISHKESSEALNLCVTPNPFQDVIHVSFVLPQSEECCLRLYSANGILVMDKALGTLKEGSHTVELTPEIFPGAYVLRLSCGNTLCVSTIFKEN